MKNGLRKHFTGFELKKICHPGPEEMKKDGGHGKDDFESRGHHPK